LLDKKLFRAKKVADRKGENQKLNVQLKLTEKQRFIVPIIE